MPTYYNKTRLLEHIKAFLLEHHLKHEIEMFASGCFMIDFWIKDKMYSIQLENDLAGISLIEENTFDLSNTPDESFTDNYSFIKRMEEFV